MLLLLAVCLDILDKGNRMAILSDYYFGDPRNFGSLNEYFLGSGMGSARFNPNYQPTVQQYMQSRNRLGPENLYRRQLSPLAADLGTYVPTQMGDFTPSAGILGMDMPRLRFDPQVQPPRTPVIVEDRVAQDNPNYRAMAALEDVAAQAEPAAAQAEPAMQGAAPRRTLGLLGDMFGGASALDEYMTPEQRAQMQNQGVMAAAMQLLASSGASRVPVGLGQALGEAYGAGQKGYTAAQQNLLQSMTMKQKMDEYKRARDIDARISGALIGEGAEPTPGGTITPFQAIRMTGTGLQGPTNAAAALIGQEAPAAAPTSQADIMYNRYINASNIAAQAGDTAKATAYAALAEKARPPQETQGEPYRAADGNMYIRLKSGEPIPYRGPAPAAKPSGKPEQKLVDGKVQMVQYFDDATFKVVPSLGEVAKPEGQPRMEMRGGLPKMVQYFNDGTSKILENVLQYNPPSANIIDLEFLGGTSLAGSGATGIAEVKDYKKSGAGSTTVSVDTGQKARVVPVNKDIIDRLSAKTEQAETANQTLANIDRILPALDKAITGPLADYRTTILRVGQFMGVAGKNADEILSNTQNVVQGLAQQELNAASYTKGQGTLTGPEREMLKRSAAGDQNMSAAELRTALIAAQKMAEFRLDDQAKFLEKTTRLPGMEEYRDLYTIDRYQPSAPPAAAGADGRKPLSDIIKPRGAR
jgi:hypothetical protein